MISPILSRSRRLMLAAFLLGSITGSSSAADACLILSGEADAYRQTAAAFQQAVGMPCSLLIVDPARNAKAEVSQQVAKGRPRLALMVGSPAQEAAGTLPGGVDVVYTMVLDPPEIPGHAATGVVLKIPLADQFTLYLRTLPNKKRLGIVYNPRFSGRDTSEAREINDRFGLAILPVAIERREELRGALDKLTSRQVDAIWMMMDQTLAHPLAMREMVQHCLKERLCLVGYSSHHVKAGAVMAFSPDYADIGLQTAEHARRMLKGEKVKAVESPRKIIVYVNPLLEKQLNLGDLSKFPDVEYVR